MTKLAFFKAKAELQEGSFRDATSNFGRFPIAMLSARVCYIISLVIKSHRRVGSLVRGECIQSAGGGIRRSWRLAEWECGTRIWYQAFLAGQYATKALLAACYGEVGEGRYFYIPNTEIRQIADCGFLCKTSHNSWQCRSIHTTHT